MTTPLTTLNNATGWAGWVRTTGRWRLALTDADHDGCLARVMAHADRLPDRHRDVIVLRVGEDPNRRPSRYVRLQGDSIDFLDAPGQLPGGPATASGAAETTHRPPLTSGRVSGAYDRNCGHSAVS
jgi:hypothetical protein